MVIIIILCLKILLKIGNANLFSIYTDFENDFLLI